MRRTKTKRLSPTCSKFVPQGAEAVGELQNSRPLFFAFRRMLGPCLTLGKAGNEAFAERLGTELVSANTYHPNTRKAPTDRRIGWGFGVFRSSDRTTERSLFPSCQRFRRVEQRLDASQ